jgi:hypothetical protein
LLGSVAEQFLKMVKQSAELVVAHTLADHTAEHTLVDCTVAVLVADAMMMNHRPFAA